MSKILRRLVFTMGIAAAPMMMFGCSEEKPAAPTPPPGDTAPAAPPGDAAKPAEGAAPAPTTPAPAEAPK
jgi:hypothetical protein